ncbi:MAG: class F sortase [Dehalococcoidia bacterium]
MPGMFVRIRVVGVGLLAGVVLAACASSDQPTVRAWSAGATAATSREAAPADAGSSRALPSRAQAVRPATATATATAGTVTASQERVIESLAAFESEFGEPPDSTFARIRIPLLGVETGVASRVVGAVGVMPEPSGPGEVAWYDMSLWPGMGGAPGEGRNAIFSGHVDYAAAVDYAGVRYRGPGVFAHLQLLSPGDVIELEFGGETLRYAVTWKRQLSAASGATDWGEIWSDDVRRDAITLYTCGGDFDPDGRSYRDRGGVRAERVA